MNNFSSTIVNQMIETEVIKAEDKDYYLYQVTVLSETLMTVLSVLVIAAILKKLDASIAFLASFMILRRQTGGLHLDSFGKCYLSSIVLCTGAVLLASYLPINIYLMIVTAFSTAVIIAMGCVNHPNLDFDDSELSLIKKRARLTVIFEMLLIIVLSVFNVKGAIIGSIEMAVILCSILMILAKLLRQEVDSNGKENTKADS